MNVFDPLAYSPPITKPPLPDDRDTAVADEPFVVAIGEMLLRFDAAYVDSTYVDSNEAPENATVALVPVGTAARKITQYVDDATSVAEMPPTVTPVGGYDETITTNTYLLLAAVPIANDAEPVVEKLVDTEAPAQYANDRTGA